MIDDLDADKKDEVRKMIVQIKEVSQKLSPIMGADKIQRNVTTSLEKMVKKKVITREECTEILCELGYVE